MENSGIIVNHNGVGYTREEMDTAFDLIKSSDHWKDPINAIIPIDLVKVCEAACEFFTATKLNVVDCDYKRKNKTRKMAWVTSIGYRAGPAGDH